jgi:hypothetical protein
MDATTRKILRNAAAAVLRAGLYATGTWLVSKSVLTEGQNNLIRANAGQIVGGVLSFVGALLWSLHRQVQVNKKIDRALKASPRLSREQFEREQKLN